MYHMAAMYAAQDKFTMAEPLYRRTLDILENTPGPTQPEVVPSLESLAEICRQTNRPTQAEAFEARAQRLQSRR